MINRAFAEKFFPGRNPLDQRLLLDDNRPFEIVGVAENFRVVGGLEDPRPQFFRARTESPNALLLLRTTVTPESLTDVIRAAVLAGDPELPVANVESMEHVMRETASDPEKAIVLMSVFAVLAWSLAMIGMYGVLTNLMAARTRELGIRMALGATAGAVARMVVWQSLKPLVAGLVIGLAGSLAVSRVLRSLSHGVVPADPLTFAGVALAVFLVAPMAVWGPVRKATSAECTVALREE
jgi:ABC-type antimicrobial peptide transport system permease subunit